jgi:hypothetical protein
MRPSRTPFSTSISTSSIFARSERIVPTETSLADDSYTYAQAGVSIAGGNALIKAIAPLARATRRPGADAELGGFGGFFDLKAAGYDDPLLVAANDGVGTKLKLAIDSGRTIRSASISSRCASTISSCRAPSLCSSSTISPPAEARQRRRRKGHRGHRRWLPHRRLRADRRRDGRDAGHVSGRRL